MCALELVFIPLLLSSDLMVSRLLNLPYRLIVSIEVTYLLLTV